MVSYVLRYIYYNDQVSLALKTMPSVSALFRRVNRKHHVKKAKVFTREQLESFWSMEVDESKEFIKVVSVIGFFGVLRCIVMVNMTWDDVLIDRALDGQKVVFIQRRVSKFDNVNDLDKNRFAILFESGSGLCPGRIVEGYIECVPAECHHGKFFKQWKSVNGKSIGYRNQHFGERSLSRCGIFIAEALELADSDEYTGHCWRRSGASNAVHNGTSIEQLRALGRWQSDSVARGYVESSEKTVLQNAKLMQGISIDHSSQQRGGGRSVTQINIEGGSFHGCNFTINKE
jgi:hypothetical protein